MMEEELWRLIKDARNYEVSNQGRVRNRKTGRVLKPSKTASGRPQVVLMDGSERLGRSVVALVKKEFGFLPFLKNFKS
jgi:NUMOD4 motif-containing protein